MENLGLTEKDINFIKQVLSKYLSDDITVYIFGSRAKGTYKKYSDVDIALMQDNNIISDDIILKISADFDNSTFPYEVDVIDLNGVNPSFKQAIEKDLKELK